MLFLQKLPEVLVSIVLFSNWPSSQHFAGGAIESFCVAICWQGAMNCLRHSMVYLTSRLLVLDIEVVELVAAAVCVRTSDRDTSSMIPNIRHMRPQSGSPSACRSGISMVRFRTPWLL